MYKTFKPFLKRTHTPNDRIIYNISEKCIQDTERVLKDYGSLDPPNEGLVYWGGTKYDDTYDISMLIAPRTKSDFGSIYTSGTANLEMVMAMSKNNIIQVAQIHTHPGNWVDHSSGDDTLAPFKVQGLLSIVVPQYGKTGMQPFTICGIHRFTKGAFIRLSDKYVSKHIHVRKDLPSQFIDLRK